MISIKSKQLQELLGVSKTRSVKVKLLKFGVTLIDGEYVSLDQWQQLVDQKLSQKSNSSTGADESWLSGSSFEDL